MTDPFEPFWTDIPQPILDANGKPVLDSNGHPTYGPPIAAPPVVDVEAVRPRVDDVAKLERTRTVEAGGEDVGTFTANTRPTADEVEDVIDGALVDVLAQLPPNVDPIWYPAILRAIALRVASTIEVSFYRESVATSGPAAAWTAQFAADLTALKALIPKATYIA